MKYRVVSVLKDNRPRFLIISDIEEIEILPSKYLKHLDQIITHTESGGDKKPVAGKNIMKRMLNRKIIIPVIVITQFETFDDDRISLNSLNEEFTQGFREIWKGTVFYGNDDWSTTLKEILDKL